MEIVQPEMSLQQKETVIASLEPGDTIHIKLKGLGRFLACVDKKDNGHFGIFSTLVTLREEQYSDLSANSPQLENITLAKKAAEAVPEQSRRGFTAGQMLQSTDRTGQRHIVKLIGAMDGLLYCETDDGQPYVAGADFFDVVTLQ